MIRIRGLSLRPEESADVLTERAARALGVKTADIKELKIQKRSVDARKKPDVRIIYTVDVSVSGNESKLCARAGDCASVVPVETEYTVPMPAHVPNERPVVVGFGPAGMFAALTLSAAGLRPIVLERGADVDTRTEKVRRFWETGELDTECNVQFGEGGAGTFSDGKLTTGTNDRRIFHVLKEFNISGADDSILIDAKPHIGTDVLRTVVRNIREKIISLGGEVRFGARVENLIIEDGRTAGVKLSDNTEIRSCGVILAIGHSARDTFTSLYESGVPMAPKPFSMGVRIEHRQSDIDLAQYGKVSRENSIQPADYKLNCRFPEGDSAYTFCMCPGGYVVAAASEDGRVCTNGMSEFKRDGENANSAVLVTLVPEDFPESGALGGMHWQREVESRAFNAGGGNYRAPAQTVGDFLNGRKSTGAGSVTPTYRPGVTWCDLGDVLPEKITKTLKKAIPELGRKLRGFDSPDAVLTAPEARSSSPVRIIRGENLQSEISGLFPCGEGAGYAGGIVSAAVDGIKCAEALIFSL